MNNYEEFLLNNYDKAIKLSNRFKKTRLLAWTPLDVLNELAIQIGHVFNIDNKEYSEKGRNINNLGDELSDVLLQLIALSQLLNINLREYNSDDVTDSYNINDIVVLFGQVTEAIMEISNKRFYKGRKGYKNHESFIKSVIIKLFSIVLNYASKCNIDMNKEFNDMYIDASNFLNNFKNRNLSKEEFVDIYNRDEEYLGILNRIILNKSNYYAKTVNCLFLNPKKKTVYLQVKNHKHNNVFNHDSCELTFGGHLIANESVSSCLARESKEETGINLNKTKLLFINKRRKTLTLNKNYKINEFQYFYIYNDLINLEDLTPDNKESMFFVEIKISKLMGFIKNPQKSITGVIYKNKRKYKRKLTLNNFNKNFFIDDPIVYSLLNKAKENSITTFEFLKYKMRMNKLLKVYNKLTMYDKKYEEYFTINLDDLDIQTKDVKEIINDDFMYCLTLTKEFNGYSLNVFISKNYKILARNLFYKDFSNYDSCKRYFYEIQKYISNNTNETILKTAIRKIKH